MITGYNKPGIILSKNLYQDQLNIDTVVYGSKRHFINRFLTPNIYQKEFSLLIYDKSGELYDNYNKILTSTEYGDKTYNVININFNNKKQVFHYNPIQCATNIQSIKYLADLLTATSVFVLTTKMNKLDFQNAFNTFVYALLLHTRFLERQPQQNFKRALEKVQSDTIFNDIINNNLIDKQKLPTALLESYLLFKTYPYKIRHEVILQTKRALIELSKKPYYEEINCNSNINMMNSINNLTAYFITPYENETGFDISIAFLMELYAEEFASEQNNLANQIITKLHSNENYTYTERYNKLHYFFVDLEADDLKTNLSSLFCLKNKLVTFHFLTSDKEVFKTLDINERLTILCDVIDIYPESKKTNFHENVLIRQNDMLATNYKLIEDKYYDYTSHFNYKSEVKDTNITNDLKIDMNIENLFKERQVEIYKNNIKK